MKQPERRSRDNREREQSGKRSMSDSPAALGGKGGALKREIGGGRALAAVSGDRDRQVVDQAGDDERDEHCWCGVDFAVEGAEDQVLCELMKGGVPTAAPKIGERGRAQRVAHEGRDGDASALPEEG